MPGEQRAGFIGLTDAKIAGGDLAGDVGAVGIDRMILRVRLQVTEFEGCGGVAMKSPLIVIGQLREGLLAGDAGGQTTHVVTVDQFGGIGGQGGGQVRVGAGENVGLAHQDHGVECWAGRMQVQGGGVGEFLRGGVISEVLGDPPGDLGDSPRGTAYLCFDL
ncbi:hypothetical protein [Mycobacterium persicum]|uniref:hypothetical protein n=1 Tax=Mycobacterium persicum TaxID=1487726 RepID=UPI001301DFE0|nr:hypothetical protein [Mycobacterium persicum]